MYYALVVLAIIIFLVVYTLLAASRFRSAEKPPSYTCLSCEESIADYGYCNRCADIMVSEYDREAQEWLANDSTNQITKEKPQ